MVAAADSILAALNDPSLWVVQQGVNVFDEHNETKPDGTAEVFDVPRLQRIAANCNQRDAIGQPCPLAIGHTKDEAPEAEQPPIVGYARQFRVEWDQRLGRYVIRADYYIRRDQAALAEQYPRTSVERWPGVDFFDPIALLRRTPRLDLGQWTYARPSGRVRYSMPDFAPPGPAGMPATSPACPPDEYAKFCAHMKRYEAEKAAPPAPATPPGAPPAVAAAPPTPPANPAAPPRPPEKKEEETARMQRESEALRYQRLEEQIAAERYARRKAEAERACIQLEAEGYRIQRATEVERMAKLTEAQQAEREKEIRENYQRAPVSRGPNDGFVPTARTQGPGGPKALDRDGFERAQKYQREKKVSWEEAVAHELGTGA